MIGSLPSFIIQFMTMSWIDYENHSLTIKYKTMLEKIIKSIAELTCIIAAVYCLYVIHVGSDNISHPTVLTGLLVLVIIFFGYAFTRSFRRL